MNDFTIRRRMLEDGKSEHDVDELLTEIAEHRSDEERDRQAEQHFKDKK